MIIFVKDPNIPIDAGGKKNKYIKNRQVCYGIILKTIYSFLLFKTRLNNSKYTIII